MGATTPEEILGMSDEDFMKELAPAVEPAAVKTPEEIAAEEEAARVAQAAQEAEAQAAAQAAADAEAARVAAEQTPAAAVVPAVEDKAPTTDPAGQPPAGNATTKPGAVADPLVQPEVKPAATDVDYKKAYEAVMAPFKANGTTMQVKTPEEAIQLMQMGANYTRKMQELQPQRKTLLLLENNGLMDEAKLSYLIDLSKGNPEAIKKLIKESDFDVLGADLDKESTYQGGNHTVTDEEVNFRTVLDELNSNPAGKETLGIIGSTWDQASKEVLWSSPEVMATIHAQRESGIYARITTEIERRRTFGQIQPGTPFLHAYKAVGDDLQKAGAFNDVVQSAPPPAQASAPAAAPVAVKAVLPKPTNVDQRIAAAAVTHSAPVASGNAINPLAMSDDDFLKMLPPQ